MKKFLTVLAFSLFAAGASQAATVACSNGDLDGAVDCEGLFVGNVQQAAFNPNDFDGGNGYFGINTWVEFDGDTDFNGGPTGSISIAPNTFSMILVFLKSANKFGAYKLNDFAGGTLDFITANSRGLSNYRVYGTGPSPIPLPAGGLLLIAGLGGLALMRRKKET